MEILFKEVCKVSVKEGVKYMGDIQKKTKLLSVSYNNNSIVIENVPHTLYIEKTPNGNHSEYTLPGSVSLKLSAIAEFMKDNYVNVFDFEEYEKFPEIKQYIYNLM